MATRPRAGKHSVTGQSIRPVPLEDAELIERVKSGQTEAFGELVQKYQDRVFNTCWRICGHLEDARDLTQEAFLKALDNIQTFRQESGFYTWIFRVAVNLALSHRRKGMRHSMVSLDTESDFGGTQASQLTRHVSEKRSADPDGCTSDLELQGRAVRALNALDNDHRAVIVLRDIEGMSYHEIGEILGIPPGTVRSRLFRGRMALRQAILPLVSRPKQVRKSHD